MEDLELLHLSWDNVQLITENLAEKIKKSQYKPDIIVAVSRGGFDPARILCDQLMIRNLASIQVVYYTGVNEKLIAPEIKYPLNAKVRGMKALLVDDVSDSGNSLMVAKEHVESMGADEVRVATLHYKPWSNYKPDYYGDEAERWIVYPWEVKETLLALTEQLKAKRINENSIREMLKMKGFKSSDIEKYLF